MKAAVLGSPISHSLSPALHNAAYEELGIDIEYTAIDTAIEALAQRISELSEILRNDLTFQKRGDDQHFIGIAPRLGGSPF